MLDVLHSHSEPTVRHDEGVLEPYCHLDASAFHPGVGSLDVLRALRSSRQQQRQLALNLQVPAHLRVAGHCMEAYFRGLAQEIERVGCHVAKQQRVEQFHLGGLTPEPARLQQLMSQLRRRFNFIFDESDDYSVDVDVQHTTWATMGVLRELGFLHVSIGVPDIANGLSVASFQNPAPIQSLIDAARTFGFRTVSVDLGYGHAWQTPDSVTRKLATLIELEPDRLQVFDYAQPPLRYAHCGQRLVGSAPDKTLMRRICFERLLEAGYQHIGLGLFVRPDDDLAIAQERGRLHRNILGFTRYGYCDHLGVGLGAISQIDTLYAQNAEALGMYLEKLQQGQLATCRGWLPTTTA
ncbi:coproporphyrinogen III oxidase [Pseudomonas sp. H9]|nr:coproporphyrinogen III oxidase [Pseudomonas sp. H9]